MKPQMLAYVGLALTLSSCPEPYSPEFCARPDRIEVPAACYQPTDGLVLQAATINSPDTTIKLNWTVYFLADTNAKAPFFNPKLNQVSAGYVVVLADSLLKNNKKLYVEVQTTCAGVNNNKAVGAVAAAFVKRYNKVVGCDQWEQQPF